MTNKLVFSTTFMAIAVRLLAVESAIPERAPASKYDKLKNEAPFAVASEAPPPAVDPGPKWSDGLFLSGVYKIDGPSGKIDVVNIINRNDPGTLITLEGSQLSNDMQLVTLEYSDDGLKTKATIKKGNDFATIGRDQAAYVPSIPQQPPPGVARPGKGIVLPNTNGMIRPPTTPSVAQIPRPNIVPPPQNRPAAAAPIPGLPSPGAAQPGQQPQNERRRIRVIGNGK